MNHDEFSALNAIIAVVLMVGGFMVLVCSLWQLYTIAKDYLKWRRQFPFHSFITGKRKR